MIFEAFEHKGESEGYWQVVLQFEMFPILRGGDAGIILPPAVFVPLRDPETKVEILHLKTGQP